MPISIEKAPNGGINLIPVDYFTRAFLALFGRKVNHSVYHITNARSAPMDEMIAYTSRFFQLTGLRTIIPLPGQNPSRNVLESLLDKYLGEYNPYLRDERVFNMHTARRCLEKEEIRCPDMNYPQFENVMQYALQTNWGKQIGFD